MRRGSALTLRVKQYGSVLRPRTLRNRPDRALRHRHLPACGNPLDGYLRDTAQGQGSGIGQGLGNQLKGSHQENNRGKNQQDAQIFQPPPPQQHERVVEDVQMLAQAASHQRFSPSDRPGQAQKEPVGKCSMAPG